MFPRGRGLGLEVKGTENLIIIEMVLNDDLDYTASLEKPWSITVVDNRWTIHPFRDIGPLDNVIQINISDLPLLSCDDLKEKLFNTFTGLGTVVGIVIFGGDITGSWFTSNGHMCIVHPFAQRIIFSDRRLHLERSHVYPLFTNGIKES